MDSQSSAKRFLSLSDEVKLSIDQLVALNPKTTPGTIMGCLVEHASFADRHFLTGTCRRADTTRNVSALQRRVGCTLYRQTEWSTYYDSRL
jgi:hypothetical protein